MADRNYQEEYRQQYQKHYPVLLLRDLLDGHDRKINQYVCRMVDGKLCIVAQEITQQKEVLLNFDISLSDFIEIAMRQFELENDIDK